MTATQVSRLPFANARMRTGLCQVREASAKGTIRGRQRGYNRPQLECVQAVATASSGRHSCRMSRRLQFPRQRPELVTHELAVSLADAHAGFGLSGGFRGLHMLRQGNLLSMLLEQTAPAGGSPG